MTPNDPAEARSHAEALFAEYLRRREQGEDLPLENFVREHPEDEARLRRIANNWDRVGGVIGRLAGSDSDAKRRAGEPSPTPIEVCDRLVRRRSAFERYRVDGEIARGGMGTVLRAWDGDLRRHVAMKVVLEESDSSKESDGSGRLRRLSRFLDEAQITGQLDHPGIVPVHELGLDENGKLYFTLKLVRGRDLREVFEQVRSGSEGWSQTRALGVLLRVCEAMSFAHERGVIHRDLKPANIMVGRHGETYVMDWGLARVLGEEDLHDMRLREHVSSQSLVHSDRRDAADETPDSPLVTMDGDILGTPQYMPPEQASGALDRIGPASDVYAVGAMLYELLAGRAPYLKGSARVSPQAIWRWVMERPPQPLAKLAPHQPAELVAICEKAMAREIDERYPDMSALADDLRAFLEHRVVRAWRTGALVELTKWVERNRAAASLLALLVLLAVGAAYGWAWLERVRQRENLVQNARLHVEQAERGWRIHPDSVPAMQNWLENARDLVGWLPLLTRERDELREHGRPFTDDQWAALLEESPLRQLIKNEQESIRVYGETTEEARSLIASGGVGGQELDEANQVLKVQGPELEAAKTRLEELDRRFRRGRGWSFQDTKLASWYERIAETVADLEDLARAESGWIARTDQALSRAKSLDERPADEARQWADNLELVAAINAEDVENADDPSLQTPYRGALQLEPQLGLVPLGQNSQGLWEFCHVLSGKPPQPKGGSDAPMDWEIRPETGIVFVLIPGRMTQIGEEGAVPRAGSTEPATELQTQVRPVQLDPYFLSKYELTQAQWERLGGGRPSTIAAGDNYREVLPITWTHPVESIGWDETLRLLQKWGLEIPTEAQWEFAARSGEDSWTIDRLPSGCNARGIGGRDVWSSSHGPVDLMETNDWGLVGMFGNVSEWTRDWINIAPRFDEGTPQSGTGEIVVETARMHTRRGGMFLRSGDELRPSRRENTEQDYESITLGIRPCRRLD